MCWADEIKRSVDADRFVAHVVVIHHWQDSVVRIFDLNCANDLMDPTFFEQAIWMAVVVVAEVW